MNQLQHGQITSTFQFRVAIKDIDPSGMIYLFRGGSYAFKMEYPSIVTFSTTTEVFYNEDLSTRSPSISWRLSTEIDVIIIAYKNSFTFYIDEEYITTYTITNNTLIYYSGTIGMTTIGEMTMSTLMIQNDIKDNWLCKQNTWNNSANNFVFGKCSVNVLNDILNGSIIINSMNIVDNDYTIEISFEYNE